MKNSPFVQHHIMFVALKTTKFNTEQTLVNADCQNVILLDYCRNNLLPSATKELRTRQTEAYTMIQICESKLKMIQDANTTTNEDNEETTPSTEDTPEAEELSEWKTYVEKITTALDTLENKDMTVEFHDSESNTPMNLSSTPKQAAKDTLTVRSNYSLMCYIEEKEPASVFDMCDVESPLERQKIAEEAAKAAAKAAKLAEKQAAQE